MSQPRSVLKRVLAYAVSASIVFPGPVDAALTVISNEPLATPAASVKPNIMLILDDSGSMEEQYTPDYVGRRFGGSNALCFDAGDDSSGSITTGLDNCQPGDPPLMSPELNTQYYNPEIRYYPAVNFDGTSKTIMNSVNTLGWTVVPTDGVSPVGVDTYRRTTLDMAANVEGSTVTTTVNLTTGYPDRVWCDLPSRAATDTTNCRTNSGYTYPNFSFPYGRDSSTGPIKFRSGAPYYYRLLPTEFCTDATLTNCTASTVPTGSFVVPAPVRYCTNDTLSSCQAKFKPSGSPIFTYPKFAGNVATSGPGSVATGTITVTSPQKDTAAGTITSLVVNGVNIIGANISLGASFTPSAAATAIRDAINSHASAPDYTATVSSNVVTVRYAGTPPESAAPNGFTITPAFNITSASPSAGTTAAISGAGFGDSIASYQVSGINLILSSITCPNPGCGSSTSSRNTYMATQFTDAINAGGSGFTATRSGTTVTITAPAGSGSTFNGVTPTASSPGMTVSINNFAGGTTSGDVNMTTTNFSGGADPVGTSGRQFVGNFQRVNLVPFQDPPTNTIASTFPRYAGRSDCAGATCTYEEEMTNFANWYAYYRSRMQMAKTAIGRAFTGISDAFRVGFITINPSADLTNRFLAVSDFTGGVTGQRDLWYAQLYKQSSHGSTPLREALSRVGRYYGGVTSGINSGMPASPIQLACQPSYAILTTDGYWNGNAGVTLTGASIGNQDNVDSGFSTRAAARYDGALSGSTGTLSDVAMYYYKTDLRTDLADQVPVTAKDSAPHQHMTTFTVGMGLAGQLNFAQNYEDGGSADFERLKIAPSSGGLDWPVPAADTETALDDLWHAAVNGRGTFFSAKDPAELTNGLVETLNSVNARVGAGAAAATSNLQPVAGDNFAYTAQYQTVDWIGDLKAKTIDLSSGAVAFRELWSAAALLDQRNHLDRRIYTFDSTDTTADLSATPPVNGNRLKSFCAPANVTGGALPYAGCDETAGLSSTEMSYFEPDTDTPGPSGWTPLGQATIWESDGSGRKTAATKEKLVDYLRGDTSNEIVNAVTPTTADLFRNRLSLMGDIVNAQPAYVKASPFGYNSGSFAGRDPYYVEFKNTTNGLNGTRKGTVFAAANDGVLHAFETDPDNNPFFQTAGITTTLTGDDAFTGSLNTSPTAGEGAERWAYIPSMILPNLMRLGDAPYSHRYYTDGSPVVGDVCFGHTDAARCSSQASWRTILVGGLNAGGRGYYALDITNPDSPKGLWEFKGGAGTSCILLDGDVANQTGDCNVGLSYGNPLIVKLPATYTPAGDAGKWVVIFTSGYNNVSPGDGVGHLYIVDAQTGQLLRRMSTGVGDTTTPSGLGRINAWVDNAFFDNTALTVYGGDLGGRLWRFQLATSAGVAANSVTRLATLVDFAAAAQPITTKPELGEVNGKRVIFMGTGRFLGNPPDKTDTQKQSIYAIKDEMDDTASPPPINMTRTGTASLPEIAGFVRQDLSAIDANTRTTTKNNVDFTSTTVKGWFIDLPDGATGGNGSERVNVDMVLQLGTLVVPSNVPSGDTCVAGGFGWLNFLDYKTGGYIEGATANMTSSKVSGSLVVGINVVQLPGGTVKTIATTADNQQLTSTTPVAPSSVEGRRVSWRELFFE